MTSEPIIPERTTPPETDEALHRRLATELEHLQEQLADIDARRRGASEADERRRTERHAESESAGPGIPE